jgi:hypothetical protein
LSWQERVFIASLAPRGIVAAAVASLFAQQLEERDIAEGTVFRALVFLVIAITVTVHGLTGGFLARWLGVRRPSGNGYVILGGNPLARALGRVLREDGQAVLFIDSNADTVRAVQAEGFEVIHGQGLQPAVLEQADPDSRGGCVALTPNEEVNLLFVRRVRDETRMPELFVALQLEREGIPAESVHQARAAVLFGRSRRLDYWTERFDHDQARVERWSRTSVPAGDDRELRDAESTILLAVRRRGRMRPFDDEVQLGTREEIAVVLDLVNRDAAEGVLRNRGWTPTALRPIEVAT